jgi:hypothetical protein
MNIITLSMLLNCSLAFIVFALALALLIVSLDRARKTAHLALIDAIEIYSRWQAAQLDVKGRALEVAHRGRMLEVESDQAQMGIRLQRRELLAALDEVTRI